MTEGLLVLVHEVIAAMTTLPSCNRAAASARDSPACALAHGTAARVAAASPVGGRASSRRGAGARRPRPRRRARGRASPPGGGRAPTTPATRRTQLLSGSREYHSSSAVILT